MNKHFFPAAVLLVTLSSTSACSRHTVDCTRSLVADSISRRTVTLSNADSLSRRSRLVMSLRHPRIVMIRTDSTSAISISAQDAIVGHAAAMERVGHTAFRQHDTTAVDIRTQSQQKHNVPGRSRLKWIVIAVVAVVATGAIRAFLRIVSRR